MKILKIILAALLVVVSALYGLTSVSQKLSGSDVPPTIQCGSGLIEISVSDPEEVLLTGVTASDKQDGDLTGRILIQGVSKLITNDTAKVTYLVFDSDGNAASCSRMVRYTDYRKPVFALEQALNYTQNEDIELLDRLSATDVLDGDITSAIRVSTLCATSDPEVSTVTVQVTNSMGDTALLDLPIVVYSGTAVRPEVRLTDYLVYLEQGDSFQADSYLRSVSTSAGSGNVDKVEISGSVDTSEPGTYYVYYRYSHGTATGLTVLTVVVA